jgi:hypothetical protein
MKLDRLNLVVLVLFPILTLGAIKLTNLILPAKYYFSLSKLAKGADEPFIVDPPSVTESKFCDLLKKYDVQSSDVNLPYIDCDNLQSGSEPAVTAYAPTSDERDEIFRIAFQNDQRAISYLRADLMALPRQPIAPDRLDTILNSSRSVMAAFNALAYEYSNPYRSIPYNDQAQLVALSDNAFQPILRPAANAANPSFDQNQSGGQNTPQLSPQDIARIRQAHQNFVSDYLDKGVPSPIRNIAVRDIENILKSAYASSDIPRNFSQFYAEQAGDSVAALMKGKFVEANLNIANTEEVRKEILSDVSQTGIFNYTVSALARVAPIFLIAILFGIYFGRRDVLSIAAASALLAFLLVWPIILLWDTVVQSQWASYREFFLGIYLLYVIAFFAVAQCGALIGAYIGERLTLHEPVAIEAKGGTADGDGIVQVKGYGKEIFVSLMASTIFSLVAFSMNLILPLNT